MRIEVRGREIREMKERVREKVEREKEESE